jgi:hypothetical protein
MQKPRDDACGCAGSNKPLYELRNLVASLERQEAERKAREDQEKLAAMSRWALGEEKKAG